MTRTHTTPKQRTCDISFTIAWESWENSVLDAEEEAALMAGLILDATRKATDLCSIEILERGDVTETEAVAL